MKKALDQIGDLAITVTFASKASSDFNFGTGMPNLGTPVTLTVKGLLKESGKEKTENSTKYAKLLVSAEDVSMPDLYDTVTIGTDVWTIVAPFESNGYTSTLTLNKEV